MAKWLDFMRGNVLVMTVCECVWWSTIDIIGPFLSLYVLELGGSYETIGLRALQPAHNRGARVLQLPVVGID